MSQIHNRLETSKKDHGCKLPEAIIWQHHEAAKNDHDDTNTSKSRAFFKCSS